MNLTNAVDAAIDGFTLAVYGNILMFLGLYCWRLYVRAIYGRSKK